MKPSDTHSNLTFTFIFFGGKLFRPSIKNITLFGHGQSVLEEIGLIFETRIQDDSEFWTCVFKENQLLVFFKKNSLLLFSSTWNLHKHLMSITRIPLIETYVWRREEEMISLKVTEKEKEVLKRNFWEREFSLVSAVGWWIMCFSCIWLLYNCMLI